MTGTPFDLAAGGACAWRLPPGESGPALARSLLVRTLTALRLDSGTVQDGELAVSEVATNAFQHARPEPGLGPLTAPELWVYARTWPAPALVVSVFDAVAAKTPRPSGADLLAENGKGMDIIGAVTTAWGCRRSRSRLAVPYAHGKAVWFALPLPEQWPGRRFEIAPTTAAKALHQALSARGVDGSRHDDATVSMLELPTMNVWIEPKHFAWQPQPGLRVRPPCSTSRTPPTSSSNILGATQPSADNGCGMTAGRASVCVPLRPASNHHRAVRAPGRRRAIR
jgi:hypothetical protein